MITEGEMPAAARYVKQVCAPIAGRYKRRARARKAAGMVSERRYETGVIEAERNAGQRAVTPRCRYVY